jgi:hypothetical protein
LPPRRSPVALSDAITRDIRDRLRLAGILGTGATLAVWLLTGYLELSPSVGVAEAVLGGSTFFVVALITMAVPFLPARERRALEAVYWTAGESSRRWQETFGDPRVPATPRQALAWLARHPDDTDETRGARAFAKLVIGDLEEAERLVARMPAGSARQRYEREAAAAMTRLVDGRDPDIPGLHRLAADLETDERFGAEVDAGMLEGLLAAAEGRDWRPALLALRERLGDRARNVLVRVALPVVAFLAANAIVLTLASLAVRAVLL